MKTAEEWMQQMSGLKNDSPALLVINRMAIREIQTDAYKAGMVKAAEIANNFDDVVYGSRFIIHQKISSRIITDAEQLKEIPK